MVEEGADISAFESFGLEDAGGDKAAPAPKAEETKEEASKPAPETQDKPEAVEPEVTGERLQAALDREPQIGRAHV